MLEISFSQLLLVENHVGAEEGRHHCSSSRVSVNWCLLFAYLRSVSNLRRQLLYSLIYAINLPSNTRPTILTHLYQKQPQVKHQSSQSCSFPVFSPSSRQQPSPPPNTQVHTPTQMEECRMDAAISTTKAPGRSSLQRDVVMEPGYLARSTGS